MRYRPRIGRWLAGLLLAGASLFLLSACLEVDTPAQARYITDAQGRALILHGLNAGDAKWTPDRLSGDSEAFIERQAKVYGFNVVRFLVFWEMIEPQPGVYDEVYLANMEAKVKRYTDQGIYVLIDFHQDVYGPAVNGNGAPAWATDTDGKTVGTVPLSDKYWWLSYIDPAVIAAFKNFWEYGRRADLQDHYIAATQQVALRLKNNPGVIGYDLMNEPFPGELGKAIDGSFQRTWLKDFYNRIIPKLREVEPDKYLFFEPQSFGINFGAPDALPKISDTRAGDSRVVYAPHLYPMFLHEGNAYSDIDRSQMRDWSRNRAKELDLHQAPLVVGELGGSDSSAGFGRYLDDSLNMIDAMGGGFIWWNNTKGSWGLENDAGVEFPKTNHIVRTYPRAIAGEPISFNFVPGAADFTLKFKQKAGVGGPTEIFVPKRHYPEGWVLDVSDPQGAWTSSYDDATQILKVWTDSTQPEHTIRVHRKFQSLYAVHLGKCLGSDYGNTANGTQAVIWECNGANDQGWILGSDNTIHSKKAPGQCLDVNGAITLNATKVQLYQCNGSNAQKWYWDNGLLRSGVNWNRCLDVAYGGDSTKMQIWDCMPGAASQVFTQKPEGASQYSLLKSEVSGLCLDINGGRMENGNRVLAWTCHGGDNQRWRVDAASGHVHSKKDPRFCLDNRGNTQAGGTEWGIWRCVDSDNLRFFWTGNSLRPYKNIDLLMQADSTANGSLVHQQAGDGTEPLSRWTLQP